MFINRRSNRCRVNPFQKFCQMSAFENSARRTTTVAASLILTILMSWVSRGLCQQQTSSRSKVGRSTENMVASVDPLATQAGINAFEKGGNAIDAAIATALTLGVVDGYNSGIGGGCFVLIRTADGKFYAIDGREMAAAAAHRDMYIRDGKPDGKLSQTGSLAIGVPGALKAYSQSVERFGKLKFADLIRPAAEIAEKGFEIDRDFHGRIRGAVTSLRRFPGSKAVLLDDKGNPRAIGERLVQKDLAVTYRMIGENGPSWYYEGEFANKVEQWMKANGGIITADDFRNYKTVQRTPVRTTYRGYEIVGFPPPSSGGVHVAQILNILENFDVASVWKKDPDQGRHLIAEAMKLAFADRAHWLGDPDFAKVPRGLIDKSYAEELAAKIDLSKATPVTSHGQPPLADAELFERHTTHVAAADKAGNWVAITTTVNTTFGSKVIIPGLGVVMNNQMDDFSIAPGVANAYGLIGTEANSVQPGKRPLSSMSPSIILKDGQPIMTVGAAGGPRIITQALLAIVRHLDLGMPIDQAVGQTRWHHQWSPDRLFVERGTSEKTIARLKDMGHSVVISSSAGISQAITYDSKTKTFTGVHDPRIGGMAGGTSSKKQKAKLDSPSENKSRMESMLLWPDGAPLAKGSEAKDKPKLTYSIPENCNGTSVVIYPGGGYRHLAMGHEGTDIVAWFNKLGIAAFICEYRHRGKGYGHPAPMMDALRAIRTVRANAKKWGLDPERVGIIGFSAGGHLASTVSTHFEDVESDDRIDAQSGRPDFAILGYPVVAFGEEFTHRGSQTNLMGKDANKNLIQKFSNEKMVTKDTPPTFLWHTVDDKVVSYKNSVAYFEALCENGVPAEMHLFPKGRHGLGMAKGDAHVSRWTQLCESWLRDSGFIADQ